MPTKPINKSDWLKKSAGNFGASGHIKFVPDEKKSANKSNGASNAKGAK